MARLQAFDPARDILSLKSKVILITGGTAGLGSESVKAFAAHDPEHAYFTGRDSKAADALRAEVALLHPNVQLTFMSMDLSSLKSVKDAVAATSKHQQLHILMNNTSIAAKPPSLSKDGYEIQSATYHLGHAMLSKQLLPFLIAAANEPNSDVRIINNTSDGYELYQMIRGGIAFKELDARSDFGWRFLGLGYVIVNPNWQMYSAAEFARRYPKMTSVSVHPGVVSTPMNTDMGFWTKHSVSITCRLQDIPHAAPYEGAWNQLWCAAGAKKEELTNGGIYSPVAQDATRILKGRDADSKLAEELWEWTKHVLEGVA